MGRRWGKTILGGDVALSTSSAGGRVAWVVPEYKNGNALWRWCYNVAAPLKRYGVSANKTERAIEFPNNGYLGIYSADNEDSIRSEAFDLVIMDEAARISETAWTDAIMPTLADRDGDAILISTPRGRNWFWNEYSRGLADGNVQASWTAPSSDNPMPNIRKAFELARERVPEVTFRQEWLAEFVDSEGAVFRKVKEAATSIAREPQPNGQYVMGVDIAASIDYTVISILDAQTKEMVHMDRFNRVDYPTLEDRIHAAYMDYRCTGAVIEANSIGAEPIQRLTQRGMYIVPFTTTNVSKAEIISSLQSAFEHGQIKIINDPALVGELLSFESKKNASGTFSYSAPDGMHDDCVMSLAFAWHAIGKETTMVDNPFDF